MLLRQDEIYISTVLDTLMEVNDIYQKQKALRAIQLQYEHYIGQLKPLFQKDPLSATYSILKAMDEMKNTDKRITCKRGCNFCCRKYAVASDPEKCNAQKHRPPNNKVAVVGSFEVEILYSAASSLMGERARMPQLLLPYSK